jgi:hypothetical protein
VASQAAGIKPTLAPEIRGCNKTGRILILSSFFNTPEEPKPAIDFLNTYSYSCNYPVGVVES